MEYYEWDLAFGVEPAAPTPTSAADSPDEHAKRYEFSADELRRLVIYRAACNARFYCDD